MRWPKSTGAALLVAAIALPAGAGDTIGGIKARGHLRCGVSEGIVGFSAKDASGRWVGLGADFCRAIAAAVLGDPEKVQFRPLKATERFPALTANTIDVLARIAVWTMSREVLLNLRFPGVLLYDEQGFMVRADSGVRSVSALNGASVCVAKGTTHVEVLTDYFEGRRARIEQVVVDSSIGVADAFFAGKCRAWTSDVAQLAAARLRAPGGAHAYVILTEHISKEPLGPVVRRGDDEWYMAVRWVLFNLIAAEESGVTQANVDTAMSEARGPSMQRTLQFQKEYAKALGLREDWMLRSVKAAGNYGEMFERNLGEMSALKLPRGANRLWTKGGLMYAPPLH